jgi:uncharacterized membrane protein YjdF
VPAISAAELGRPGQECLGKLVAIACIKRNQGDEWDAQKDSFLAFNGAIVAMLVTWQSVRKRGRETIDCA